MKKIITVQEHNKDKQGHMAFRTKSGSKRTIGFVVVDENGTAMFCSTLSKAQVEIEKEWKINDQLFVSLDERAYDWGVDMSYRLTGKGSETIMVASI